MKLQDPAVEAGSLICKANISLRKHVNGSCEDWKSMFASCDRLQSSANRTFLDCNSSAEKG